MFNGKNNLQGFWFWKKKLPAIMLMLSALADYTYDEEEVDVIGHGIHNSNEDANIWFDYKIVGKQHTIHLSFAIDNDDSDIVFIKIEAPEKLRDKIDALNTFQSIFDELITYP